MLYISKNYQWGKKAKLFVNSEHNKDIKTLQKTRKHENTNKQTSPKQDDNLQK